MQSKLIYLRQNNDHPLVTCDPNLFPLVSLDAPLSPTPHPRRYSGTPATTFLWPSYAQKKRPLKTTRKKLTHLCRSIQPCTHLTRITTHTNTDSSTDSLGCPLRTHASNGLGRLKSFCSEQTKPPHDSHRLSSNGWMVEKPTTRKRRGKNTIPECVQ